MGQQDGTATAAVTGSSQITVSFGIRETPATDPGDARLLQPLTVTDQDGCQGTANIKRFLPMRQNWSVAPAFFPTPLPERCGWTCNWRTGAPGLYVQDVLKRIWMKTIGSFYRNGYRSMWEGCQPGYWLVLRSEGRLEYSGRFVVY